MWKKRGKLDKWTYDHPKLTFIAIAIIVFCLSFFPIHYFGKLPWEVSGIISLGIIIFIQRVLFKEY